MPFGLDITVAVGIRKGLRRDVEHAVVEHIEDVNGREVAAGVPGARLRDDAQDRLAVVDGLELEFPIAKHRPLPQ